MNQSVMYVGLDIHKDTIAVAVAEDGKRAEVREHREIANTPAALSKLLGELGGPDVELHNSLWSGGVLGTNVRFRSSKWAEARPLKGRKFDTFFDEKLPCQKAEISAKDANASNA